MAKKRRKSKPSLEVPSSIPPLPMVTHQAGVVTPETLRPKAWLVRKGRRLQVVRWPRVLLRDDARGIKFWSRVRDVARTWTVEVEEEEGK